MTTFLAAIDDTDAAEPVLFTALALARAVGAKVRALHARSPATDKAEHIAAAHGVPLTVVDLPAETAIVESAGEPDVDFVVLALHREPIGGHEAGHTALAVFAQTTKPVLVVPPRAPLRDTFKRVIVPLDGTRAVSSRVSSTIRVLASSGFDVVVLHVFDAKTVPRFLDSAADLRMWADEFVRRNIPRLEGRLEVRSGDVVTQAVDLAAAEGADMIVLVWRQDDVAGERGQVMKRLLVEARRPVMLIPIPSGAD